VCRVEWQEEEVDEEKRGAVEVDDNESGNDVVRESRVQLISTQKQQQIEKRKGRKMTSRIV